MTDKILDDFHVGTTYQFGIYCKLQGTAQDITSDAVTLYMKTAKSITDANATVSVSADCATFGASGLAWFEIAPADTKAVTPASYFVGIKWVTAAGKEYVIYDEEIELLERVSDVPS